MTTRLDQHILLLLDEHESLAQEQIASHLHEPTHDVRLVLNQLRGIGFVEGLAVGKPEAHVTRPVAYRV
jgi:hypothetical protein